MKLDQLGEALVTTAAFSLVGLLLFCLAFFVMDKLTPFSLRKEIEEDHNTALAIIMAAVVIGMALIVSAAVSG
jgi:putative membrane protein